MKGLFKTKKQKFKVKLNAADIAILFWIATGQPTLAVMPEADLPHIGDVAGKTCYPVSNSVSNVPDI